jgi:hypothetical protein
MLLQKNQGNGQQDWPTSYKPAGATFQTNGPAGK